MKSTLQLQRRAWLALSTLMLILLGVFLLTIRPNTAFGAEDSPPIDSAALSKAVVAMEQLDQMRRMDAVVLPEVREAISQAME